MLAHAFLTKESCKTNVPKRAPAPHSAAEHFASEEQFEFTQPKFSWSLGEVQLSAPGENGPPPPGDNGAQGSVLGRKAKPLPWPMQAKLRVGAVDDPMEREADRVSDQVIRMPEAKSPATLSSAAFALQRKCDCGSCAKCKADTEQSSAEPKRLPMKSVAASSLGQQAAPPIVHEVLRSPGHPLDAATLAFMEPRFGWDFSRVRVHTDARAVQSAEAVQARAYTVGRDVVFAAGEFSPGSHEGQKLLGHELTHVVQQRGSPGAALGLQRQPKPQPDEPAHEAAHLPPPTTPPKSLKEMGISAQDKLSAAKMLPIIDAVFARNPTIKPYIAGRLQQTGREIAAPGKVIVHKTRGSFQTAYEKYSGQSTGVTSLPRGFFWFREGKTRLDEIHLPPDATFGEAFHEAVHKMSSMALTIASYFKADQGLAFDVDEGLTSLFSDLILKDEGVDDYSDGYALLRDRAKKLCAYAGFDAVAKWYWKNDRPDLLKKLGVKTNQDEEKEGKDVIRELKKVMY